MKGMIIIVKPAKMLLFSLIVLTMLFVVGCTNSPVSESPEPTPSAAVAEDKENSLPPQSPRSPITGILTEPERPWSAISVIDSEGKTYPLNPEDAQKVHQILSTMEAMEVLTPFHYEGQFSSPMFTILVKYNDGIYETIASTETGKYFFRHTDTVGNHGDRGYVGGVSETLFDILSDELRR